MNGKIKLDYPLNPDFNKSLKFELCPSLIFIGPVFFTPTVPIEIRSYPRDTCEETWYCSVLRAINYVLFKIAFRSDKTIFRKFLYYYYYYYFVLLLLLLLLLLCTPRTCAGDVRAVFMRATAAEQVAPRARESRCRRHRRGSRPRDFTNFFFSFSFLHFTTVKK